MNTYLEDTTINEYEKLFGAYSGEKRQHFFNFLDKNPGVWETFKSMALRIKATGRTRYGAACIINVMRWEMDLKTTGDTFKFSNDHISMLARLMILKYPQFDGFFQLRPVGTQRQNYYIDNIYNGVGYPDDHAEI